MKTRGSLAARISLVTVAVAVVTALVAGLLSFGLLRRADESSARTTLIRVADAAASAADRGPGPASETRARRLLRALTVQFASVDRSGTVTVASSPLAATALDGAQLRRLLDGGAVSASRTVDGTHVLVEARPTPTGGIVLVQRQSDALAGVGGAVRRVLIALLIGVVVATVFGVLFARWLAGPLRRVAQAAHALSSGRRDVAVPPEGPAEVAEVADAVNNLAASLAHSEGRQRTFLMSVSHELRTPLTAITGYAESLADGIVAQPDVGRVGQVMLDESRRLERLVADLLDLARLDAADFRMEFVPVDVVGLVRSAAQVWGRRCAAAGVEFRVETPEAPVAVFVDPARLRQAVDGLLENALRVTPSGAPIVLAARCVQGPLPVVIEVRDGGPGLADDDLPVAFDRSVLYERYRGVRRVGTGLGLAIVAGLVGRLGGAVAAGHAPEGGACFTIRLPAA